MVAVARQQAGQRLHPRGRWARQLAPVAVVLQRTLGRVSPKGLENNMNARWQVGFAALGAARQP